MSRLKVGVVVATVVAAVIVVSHRHRAASDSRARTRAGELEQKLAEVVNAADVLGANLAPNNPELVAFRESRVAPISRELRDMARRHPAVRELDPYRRHQ